MRCTTASLDLQLAIGHAIRRRRLAHGLTQADLAALAQTRRTIVSRAEAGRHALNLDSLVRYATALRCTVADIIVEAEGVTRARSLVLVSPRCAS